MSALNTLVSSLLRPTERLKAVLSAELEQISTSSDADDAPTQTAAQTSPVAVLAVVSHFDEFDGHEEGRSVSMSLRRCCQLISLPSTSIIIYTAKADHPADLSVHRVIPILDSFSTSASQAKGKTNRSLDQTRSGITQSSPGSLLRPYFPLAFRITISPGIAIQSSEGVTVQTQDVHALKAVLAECKRLKHLSGK